MCSKLCNSLQNIYSRHLWVSHRAYFKV